MVLPLNKKQSPARRAALVLLCAVLGVCVFLAVYGTGTLQVTNDSWITEGYDEFDLNQHYEGWLAFRAADWHFPLCYSQQLGWPDGTYLSFMDLNPLVSVVCKVLSPLLPATFQFFGWWALLCFALQGAAAGLLLLRVYDGPFAVGMGALFFVTAPILLERAFRHGALTAHFFVLFALYLYLSVRDRALAGGKPRFPRQFWLLNLLAVAVTPYWLPATMLFTLLTLGRLVRCGALDGKAGSNIKHAESQKSDAASPNDALPKDTAAGQSAAAPAGAAAAGSAQPGAAAAETAGTRTGKKPAASRAGAVLRAAALFAGNGAAAVALAWCFGTVGWGVSSSRAGYGTYAMNLNAPYNPTSLGGYTWSYFLVQHGQARGNYDGFNYLGFGALLLLGLALVLCAQRFAACTQKKAALRAWCSRNGWLLAACVFLCAFAVSSTVYFNGAALFSLPLPGWLASLCGIFRSSGRMFYPVYYILILYGLYALRKAFSRRGAAVLMALFLCLQLADISGAVLQKRQMMRAAFDPAQPVTAGTKQGELRLRMQLYADAGTLLAGTGETHTTLVFTGQQDFDAADNTLIMAALREGMNTNLYNANSGSYKQAQALGESAAAQLAAGKYDRTTIYVTNEKPQYDAWKQALADDGAVTLTEKSNLYFVIPGKA